MTGILLCGAGKACEGEASVCCSWVVADGHTDVRDLGPMPLAGSKAEPTTVASRILGDCLGPRVQEWGLWWQGVLDALTFEFCDHTMSRRDPPLQQNPLAGQGWSVVGESDAKGRTLTGSSC